MPEALSPASPVRSSAVVVLLLCCCALGSNTALKIPQRKNGTVPFSATPPNATSEPSPRKRGPPLLVDVNRASVEELEELSGIGPVIARRIVAFRHEVGPFRRVGDLIRVRGIGSAKLERLRGQVSVGVESDPNAGRDRDDEGVEEAVRVGGHPIAARIGTDEPAVADQIVETH